MMRKIFRILRIFTAFFRISFIADLEFRAHFISKILVDVVWYAGQLSIFESIYRFSPTIGSWNLSQTRVFLGVLFISDALYMIFFNHNLENFTDDVVKGNMDMLLTKPISSQWMVSGRRISVAHFFSLLLSIIWTFWAITQLPNYESGLSLRVIWLFILIPTGLIIHYSMRFMIVSMSLIFVRADYLQYLWYQFYRFSFRPDSLFPPNMRFLILTVLPFGFVASVPSRMVIDPPTLELYLFCIGGGLGLSSLFLYFSHKTWIWALRFYSSASS